jgi:hypothetical protein
VVAAEGYREEWVRADTDLVLLQREREPNVLLRVEHEDGAPCNDAVSGTFGRQGAARLELDACGRGLFVGTLPPGGWRVTLLAGPSDWDWDEERRRIFPSRHALFLPRRILDIEVPESGMAEPPVIRLPAWGTVELKGAWDFLLESAEGERVGGSPGTYQLPEGTYHVLRNERAVLSFDVVPGETRTVVVPAE